MWECFAEQWRLDKMLLSKADEGVNIYILLYAQYTIILDLGSDIIKQTLKHPNIKILIHPAGDRRGFDISPQPYIDGTTMKR